jgi:hypothetical protein
VVNFTPRPLYPQGRSSWFPLDRRLGARFTTLWRSENHINTKTDADALNRHRRRFCVRRRVYHIYHGQRRQYDGKCACVYDVCSVKNKIENKTNLAECNSNLTWPKLAQTLQNSTLDKVVYREVHVIKMREGMRSIRRTLRGPSVLLKTQRNCTVLFRTRFTTIWRSEIHIGLKVDADVGFFGVRYVMSVKDSEGNMPRSAHASTTYGMWRIKSKTPAIAIDNT